MGLLTIRAALSAPVGQRNCPTLDARPKTKSHYSDVDITEAGNEEKLESLRHGRNLHIPSFIYKILHFSSRYLLSDFEPLTRQDVPVRADNNPCFGPSVSCSQPSEFEDSRSADGVEPFTSCYIGILSKL